MVENFGAVLRRCRQAVGLSQRALAAKAYYTYGLVAQVEAGGKTPSFELAVALDEALGTTPYLAVVYEIDGLGVNDMRRRALITGAGALAMVAAAGGSAAAAAALQHGLALPDEPRDFDAIVHDLGRRLVIAPDDALGAAIGGEWIIARHAIADNPADREALRGGARLAQLYGLWSGNRGETISAFNYYRSADWLAERSGDWNTRSYVIGRTASRAAYEGRNGMEIIQLAQKATSIGNLPSLGWLEAFSAMVHVHTLTGDKTGAEISLHQMADVIEHLPAGARDGADPTARYASFANYLYCRVGTEAEADRAFEEASRTFPHIPVWWTEAQVYRAVASARFGDAKGAVAMARRAFDNFDIEVHTIGVAVRDLMDNLKGVKVSAEDRAFLTERAARGPMPWETVRV